MSDEADLKFVRQFRAALREEGFVVVPVSLVGRISDYFHVNSKPTDDLAQGYMRDLDAIILG